MGNLNFNFGSKNQTTAAPTTAKADRPKADLWVNIGFPITYEDTKGETQTKFVSLPVGIPLDTIEALPVKGSSEEFRALQAARNDLLEQLIEAGKALQPGEELVIDELQIQLRRVNEDAVPIKAEDNPLAKKFSFGKKSA
jgi:hypothetical protein